MPKIRSTTGAFIVEAAMSLCIMVLVWVALVGLTLFACDACYRRVHLSHLSNELALYVAGLDLGIDQPYSFLREANDVFSAAGMAEVNKCTAFPLKIQGQEAVRIEVHQDLFYSGPGFHSPEVFDLKESGVAIVLQRRLGLTKPDGRCKHL